MFQLVITSGRIYKFTLREVPALKYNSLYYMQFYLRVFQVPLRKFRQDYMQHSVGNGGKFILMLFTLLQNSQSRRNCKTK
jgi:hypothetical protein